MVVMLASKKGKRGGTSEGRDENGKMDVWCEVIRWRKQLGMIDDHDECEWVNVSSGTGSPGFSRTNSTEP